MSRELKEVYNKVYEEGKETFHTFPLEDIYLEVYKAIAGREIRKKVLDLGCGDGEFINTYMNNASNSLGVDFSQQGIIKAREGISQDMNTNFCYWDFEGFLKENEDGFLSFDVITSIGVIEHIDNPKILFEIASLMLKEGGIFVLEHPNLLNVRGAIWKALEIFFDVEMSLTDKHTILPDYIMDLARKNSFKVEKVKTFRQDLGCGKGLIADFDKRLRKALAEKITHPSYKVSKFLDFMKLFCSDKFAHKTALSGAEMIWVLKKEGN